MIPAADSLLKYASPVLVNTKTNGHASKQARPLKVSSEYPQMGPVPPPPKPWSPAATADKRQREEILNTILPPRIWTQGNRRWTQQVSSKPCTRPEVLELQERLGVELQRRKAMEMGICPIRRELYTQCFDELIRHVTINCAERGLMLMQVRDELRMTMTAYQTLCETSIAFGIRKAMAEEKSEIEKQRCELEERNCALEQQVDEWKAKCETIEKQEAEKRQDDKEILILEINSLKRTNQQLKDQLEGTVIKDEETVIEDEGTVIKDDDKDDD